MPHATPDATKIYADRFPEFLKAGHYRDFRGLAVSSLGLGTYLGGQTDAEDALYAGTIREALLSGVNLIDSAINYRCMRSERAIGSALGRLLAEGKVRREEVVVCTKGGFLPFDGEPPRDPAAYFREQSQAPGLCGPGDLVAGCHCMTPAYLRDQVGRSLKNLGLDAVDLYYLHNPETQLDEVPRDGFLSRLEKAFGELEKMAAEGLLRAYGTATWNGYRVPPQDQDHLSLEEVLRAAERAGGSRHHFAAVQLPYNLAMTEAYGLANQLEDGKRVPLLEAARRNGLAVFTSASILQSKLSRGLPAVVTENFPGLATDAQRAVQFVRSTPGVTAALVGMKRPEHLRENLGVASQAPVGEEAVARLFSGA
ncbi:MAG TPA: aldo/keto reductase [bacterium]|nr:aldo/keto reductase [bacterium]